MLGQEPVDHGAVDFGLRPELVDHESGAALHADGAEPAGDLVPLGHEA
jgi:hypothetical protein